MIKYTDDIINRIATFWQDNVGKDKLNKEIFKKNLKILLDVSDTLLSLDYDNDESPLKMLLYGGKIDILENHEVRTLILKDARKNPSEKLQFVGSPRIAICRNGVVVCNQENKFPPPKAPAFVRGVNFLFFDNYGTRRIIKNIEKSHHGLLRSIYFTLVAGVITYAGVFLGAISGGIGGYVLPLLLLNFLFPGVGLVVTTPICMLFLTVFALAGTKLGAEIAGIIGASFAKQSARLFSAIFSVSSTAIANLFLEEPRHVVNPTNPGKYEVTFDFVRSELERCKNTPRLLSADQEQENNVDQTLEITDDVVAARTIELNTALEQMYNLKKQKAKPNIVWRILGINFFATENEKTVNSDINKTVDRITSSGGLAYYDSIKDNLNNDPETTAPNPQVNL